MAVAIVAVVGLSSHLFVAKVLPEFASAQVGSGAETSIFQT